MALLNSAKELENLIPSPRQNFFDSFMQRVPSNIIKEKPLYAIVVDNITKKITSIYRVGFVLFSTDESNYLFIGDLTKELTPNSYYIKTSSKQKIEIEDWGFKKDEIGLYVVVDNICKDKIYFATEYYDAKNVRESINHKVTLIAETVYV